MSTNSLRLPRFLHKEVKGIAKEEGISMLSVDEAVREACLGMKNAE